MTDDEWASIADRIESTWPDAAGGAGRYRGHLDDLSSDVVERALDDLLIEYRNEAPPPRTVRSRARSAGADDEGGVGDDTPEPTGVDAAPEERRQSQKATVALVLGLAGLITIPLVFSVAAIVVGTRALRDIADSPGLEGATRARMGRALGWIGIVIMSIIVIVGLVVGGDG